MEDFIKRQGPAFFAHLLRRLYDDYVRHVTAWDAEIGIVAPPRTHSTMLALDEMGSLTLTELAALLRQSHPLVLTWIRQLRQLGLVEAEPDESDRRRTNLRLTDCGRRELARCRVADAIAGHAFERMMKECDAEVFGALWRLEESGRKEPFIDRLRAEADRRGLEANL